MKCWVRIACQCLAVALMQFSWLSKFCGVQDHVFYDANPPAVQAWVPHLFFLVYVLAYTEGSKWVARRYPNCFFTRWFMW
jgi:hypothetical protein